MEGDQDAFMQNSQQENDDSSKDIIVSTLLTPDQSAHAKNSDGLKS